MGEQDNIDIWFTKLSNTTGTSSSLIDNDLLNAITVSQPNPRTNSITAPSATSFDLSDPNTENNVQIDIPDLDKTSNEEAARIIRDMTDLYHDEKWIGEHPRIKKRIDIELETLRGLIKMRRADEQAHDALLNGISSNNTNASLYRSLAEIQKSSLAVTRQINETVSTLDNILKQYQLDISHQESSAEAEEEDMVMHRGSKSFIKEQIKKSED